jgi:hypothetical protein
MAATTTVDTQPTLAQRLDQARREAQPLETAVATLQHQLATSASGHDFVAAHRAQQALPAAMEAHAVALAVVASLQASVDRVQAAKTEADRVVHEAQQRHQAEHDLEIWQAKYDENTAAAHEELAAVDAGMEAIRLNFRSAQAYAAASDQAKQQVYRCNLVLGHVADGMIVSGSSLTASRLERDPVLAAIVRGRV